MAELNSQMNDEPKGRLTRIGDRLTDLFREDPEYTEDLRIIVMISSGDNEGGVATEGFESPGHTLLEVLEHVKAIAEAMGVPMLISRQGMN